MTDAREQHLADIFQKKMEGDFNPQYTPTSMPDPMHRIANAAEYAAYQLGKLNRNMETLLATMKRQGG